jgi:pyruvate/2-oxoglutarate/acetoin dehydrogenase E1 component
VEAEVLNVSIVKPLHSGAILESLGKTGVAVTAGRARACMGHFGLTARGIADRAREALVLKPIVSRPPLFGPEWT